MTRGCAGAAKSGIATKRVGLRDAKVCAVFLIALLNRVPLKKDYMNGTKASSSPVLSVDSSEVKNSIVDSSFSMKASMSLQRKKIETTSSVHRFLTHDTTPHRHLLFCIVQV
jgi:hypothetical protein